VCWLKQNIKLRDLTRFKHAIWRRRTRTRTVREPRITDREGELTALEQVDMAMIRRQILLVHDLLGMIDWTIISYLPPLIYLYRTDREREYISRGTPMADPTIAPLSPKLFSETLQCVQYMGNMSGFGRTLKRLKTWNTSEEHTNDKHRSYAMQHTSDFCSAIMLCAGINS
jgi:hypothetical protein